MAVRLAIRPRLTLRDEPAAKLRPRFRLPPLAVPAVAYWLAMAGLTYAFTRPGEPPVALAAPPGEAFEAAPARDRAPPPPPAAAPAPEPRWVSEPGGEPAPERESEPEATREPEPEPASDAARAADRRESARDEAAREPRATRSSESAGEAPNASAAPPPPERLEFPRFTDSPRSERSERASDGPRIESDLFGPARGARPAPGGAPAEPPASDGSRPTVAASCEAAIARHGEQLTIGAPRGPADVTRGAYAGVLENGRYLASCSIPERTVFEVCAAILDGRAVGITVVSSPSSAALNACVRRAVSRLEFPRSPRLDVTRTRFDAARR